MSVQNVVSKEQLIDIISDMGTKINSMPSVFVNMFNRSDILSTTEKIVGTDTDGMPIYQKSYDIGYDFQFPNNAWTALPITESTSINKIIEVIGTQDNGCSVSFNIYHERSQNIFTVKSLRTENEFVRYFTIKYTKVGDTSIKVGTGNDYSTDEQIIGTWIDGKLLYQKTTIPTTEIMLGSNTWVTISSLGDIKDIVCSIAYTKSSNNYMYYPVYTAVADGNFRFLQTRNSDMQVFAYTIQYTKTTD